MSKTLDAIIAQGFNLNPLNPIAHFREARDNRVKLESDLKSADVAQQINEFNLGQSRQQAENQGIVSTLVPELLGLQNRASGEQQAAQDRLDNFLGSAGRYQPKVIDEQGGMVTPQVGVNPALLDQAMGMLQGGLDESQQEISAEQNRIIQELAKRSPEIRGMLMEQQFQAGREWVDIDPPPGAPSGTVWQQNTTTGEKKKVGSGQTINVNSGINKNVGAMEAGRVNNFLEEGQELRGLRDQAMGNIANIQQFRRLQSQVSTGKFTGTMLELDKTMQAFGLPPVSNMNIPAAEALRGVQLEFVMQRVQQTKGAISEKEMALFEAAAPNLANTPEGNALLLDFAERVSKRQIEIQRLYTEFSNSLTQDQYGNAINLWDQTLNQYYEDNPIFSDDEMLAAQGAAGLLSNFGSAEGAVAGDRQKNNAGTVIEATPDAQGNLFWLKVQ